MAPGKKSWRCCQCGTVMKETFQCCGTCGGHWHMVMDYDYGPQRQDRDDQQNQQNWQTNNWEENTWSSPWRPRSQSPRGDRLPRREQSPRGSRGDKGGDKGHGKKGKGRGGKKGANKGKGKSIGQGKTENPFEGEPVWHPTDTTAQAAPPAPSASETQLQQLVQALRRNDATGLNPEVQTIMATVEERSTRSEVKTLYNAVGRLNQAQKQLQTAQKARTNLHLNWNGHLLESVQRWRSYVEEFGRLDGELATQLTAAQDAVRQARQMLAENRTAGTASTENADMHVVSDGEEMAEGETDGATIATAIQEGLHTMVSSLEGLQKRAEELLPEPKAKRARREAPDQEESTSAKGSGKDGAGRLGAGALEPFGGGRT